MSKFKTGNAHRDLEYLEDSLSKIPPVDLEGIEQLEAKLHLAYSQFHHWKSQRGSFVYAFTHAQCMSELAFLWEKALQLAIAVPEYAGAVQQLVNDIVHLPKSTTRRPEWCGHYEESAQDGANRARIAGTERLKRLYEQHGVTWSLPF